MTQYDTQLWKLFQRMTALVAQAMWTFAKRLALTMLLAITVSLLCALLVWNVVAPAETASKGVSITIGVLLVACYLCTGILWAVHRSYCATVEKIVPSFVEQSVELLNRVLDPLLERSPVHGHRIAVADARRLLNEQLGCNTREDAGVGWRSGVFGAVQRRIVRRSAGATLALANEVLDSLQQNGEAYVSVTSLKGYLTDKMIVGIVAMARGKARSFGMASAVIAFLLVLTPIGVPWLLAP